MLIKLERNTKCQGLYSLKSFKIERNTEDEQFEVDSGLRLKLLNCSGPHNIPAIV